MRWTEVKDGNESRKLTNSEVSCSLNPPNFHPLKLEMVDQVCLSPSRWTEYLESQDLNRI